MAEAKPRVRVKAPAVHRGAAAKARGPAIQAFDAGRSQRRLRALPTGPQAINAQIRAYGRTVIARSRYLAANNPYAANAKGAFVSALIGDGIKPASLSGDAALREALQEAWLDWTDESDADWLTDFYGQQAAVAAEMFEAGECFVRLRPREPEDKLTVPLQLQLLPSEMLPHELNRDLGAGRRIEMGIEFDWVGRRTAYHFHRRHPGSDVMSRHGVAHDTVAVPAEEVLHIYRPMVAGQVRGVPHTASAIAKLALLDQYDDAELDRKKTAALFAGFVTKPEPEPSPLGPDGEAEDGSPLVGLQPGTLQELLPGEDVRFSAPADVGPNYEGFQYRTLLAVAAGFGVPYAAMTGDLRQTSYGSIRAGLIEFRRRIEALQHHVMVYQLCRPVWRRWLDDAVIAGALPMSFDQYLRRRRELRRVEWKPPKWEWIDPLKDIAAELMAVKAGFKARSDVIDEFGFDGETVDRRIRRDLDREEALGLSFAESQFSTAMVEAALGRED